MCKEKTGGIVVDTGYKNGLDCAQVEEQRAKFGENRLKEKRKRPICSAS